MDEARDAQFVEQPSRVSRLPRRFNGTGIEKSVDMSKPLVNRGVDPHQPTCRILPCVRQRQRPEDRLGRYRGPEFRSHPRISKHVPVNSLRPGPHLCAQTVKLLRSVPPRSGEPRQRAADRSNEHRSIDCVAYCGAPGSQRKPPATSITEPRPKSSLCVSEFDPAYRYGRHVTDASEPTRRPSVTEPNRHECATSFRLQITGQFNGGP